MVILAALALAPAGDGRALDAAAAWSAPRPLDVARSIMKYPGRGRALSTAPSRPAVIPLLNSDGRVERRPLDAAARLVTGKG